MTRNHPIFPATEGTTEENRSMDRRLAFSIVLNGVIVRAEVVGGYAALTDTLKPGALLPHNDPETSKR